MLSWQASSDNIGVVGYGLYVGGFRVGSTSEPAATLTSLSCGRSYEVGIDAVDAAGNRSARASSYFSTSPCPGDKTAPSQPNKLAVGAATTSSITLSWAASTDNTGVTGYGLYRGSSRVNSTTQTTGTFSGLAAAPRINSGSMRSTRPEPIRGRLRVGVHAAVRVDASGRGVVEQSEDRDVVPRGTVWRVTVTPAPDEVDFWASDRVIATDTSAPFEVPLDLAPGDYKLGFCHRTDGVQKCATTESGDGEGIVARVTVVDSSAPSPTNDTIRPTVPGSLRVVSAGATSVNVAWSASTDNTVSRATGSIVARAASIRRPRRPQRSVASRAAARYQLGVDAVDGGRQPFGGRDRVGVHAAVRPSRAIRSPRRRPAPCASSLLRRRA